MIESQTDDDLSTSNNDFVKIIRDSLNSNGFHNIIGCSNFPKQIADDKIMVISVNELFPNRISYFILFQQYDQRVWRIEFEIHNEGALKNIISFNESNYYNKSTISLFKEINKIDGYDFWR